MNWKNVFTDDYCKQEKIYWDTVYDKNLDLVEVRNIMVGLVDVFDQLYSWNSKIESQ